MLSLTNILLIIGFILLCVYAVVSRIANKKKNDTDKNDKKENDINKD